MAFLSTTLIITLLVPVVTFFLIPAVVGYILKLVLRSIGWSLENKTNGRRELILSQVRIEEEHYVAKQSTISSASASAGPEDDDWEKVDGTVPSVAGNGQPLGEDWEGIIGFFHPFCNAGGGGERVLWAAVKATQERWPKAVCAIYTGDHEVTKAAILERVETRFNIKLHAPTVVLLYLSTRKYVLSSMYPHFTLLGQSLGSLVVAFDAFNLLVPDIYIDTMGYAFTIALCKYLFPSVPTGAYVHYPTISTDMLTSLDDDTGIKGLNSGAGSGWKGTAKRRYWHLFARLYGWVGSKVDVVMTNSSWTSAHINSLWGPSRKRLVAHKDATVVFPPTAVKELHSSIEVNDSTESSREPNILYIAQFRPEKNHALILRAFARFLNKHREKSTAEKTPKLILIGSVRHSSPDETHIYHLRLLAHELHIRDQTTFICDASWPTILSYLCTCSIGTNAMWNEHFGIGVVEYQAAGLISVVHDSGGPREDIVINLNGEGETGFRASTEKEFAAAFEDALALPKGEKIAMRSRARRSALRFTEEEFARKWVVEIEKLVLLRKK
ncbi:alpha-1,2-mannosyltransferase (Alg11), putative [Talaromyces stipitatus ATCC 10500]|uniref:GDP-Man:Man(3)GlcNAc(2)-PP-Dol alpha-1,2-mannosyltransferase n=1 Tax=Talaromyces stipitatus (strain ATCC 10500 / CBS 375.48 / QM 6759 / NRRL 1006) TaxID=441959 RepID=B8LU08_TALSN|nr:alpha-1,2-mannosyltransferase (Alg11), putative [Talaromyces stipitatus ATCC 10500]EED23838.1 alpha-1,2-mannosyltransferase (Alg11), putative [Talaromyces stipitatus ATCC 10500]